MDDIEYRQEFNGRWQLLKWTNGMRGGVVAESDSWECVEAAYRLLSDFKEDPRQAAMRELTRLSEEMGLYDRE